MKRRFGIINEEIGTALPARATKESAGYDLCAAKDVVIQPGRKVVIPTNVAAYMNADEVLFVYPRSSFSIKYDLMLANGVGVIDADYKKEILVCYRNMGNKPFRIKKGDRIAQGVFVKYIKVTGDTANGSRSGGIGSTGK